MKCIKILGIIYFLLQTISGFAISNNICLPNESIEKQRKRYLTQGLLVTVAQQKALFAWPVKVCECWISSLYGNRKRSNGSMGFHKGVDLAAEKGTPVFAAADGYVQDVSKNFDKKGYGNMITLYHGKMKSKKDVFSYTSRYAHLDTIDENINQGYELYKNGHKAYKVHKGQKIGTVGATGHVYTKNGKGDPSHLHFEIHQNDKHVDPLLYLFASDMVSRNKVNN